jgi:hypothetical protein
MRTWFLAGALALAGLLAPYPSAADDECPNHEPSVAALRTCVEHAFAAGHITSAGVAAGLLAKLDAAQGALDRGQPNTAAAQLQAFIREVQAQGGRHIEPPHDRHLLMHAEAVLAALCE